MNDADETKVNFRVVFRMVFVAFFLYLIGDAMYRWSGFRFYGSYYDFLASAALVTVFWSIVALSAALTLWALLRLLHWLCQRIGYDVKAEQILLFIGVFILLSALVWLGRAKLLQRSTTLQEELFALACLSAVAFVVAKILRNRAEQCIKIMLERSVPLGWLFGIWTVISISLICYLMYMNDTAPLSMEDVPGRPTVINSRPNIVLVTFDTLTAKDMSLYGYHRDTTPFIKEWAKSATVFTRLEAESNVTKPTTSSLMTGKRLWTHRVYHNIEGSANPLRSKTENLSRVLKANGYYTMGFIANPFASLETLGVVDSFDVNIRPNELTNPGNLLGRIHNFLYKYFSRKISIYNWIIKEDFIFRAVMALISLDVTKTEVPPRKVFDKFLSVLDGNPPAPYFAWLHIFPPHTPYLPPDPYWGMFDSRSGDKQLTGWEVKRARYDEFIRYCDEQFKYFIGEMTKKNQLENTIIILSADHGESFEHNYLGHGGPHLYEQVTHIPLVIKDAGQSKGIVVNDLVEQIDIPASILELADIKVPDWMEGRSFIPLMKNYLLESKPVFSMSLDYNSASIQPITLGTIVVWKDEYKLIHYLKEDKSLLFELEQDPSELTNLIDEKNEVGQQLLLLIHKELEKTNKRIM